MIEKVTQDIEASLKKGHVREAATLAISFLSSNAGDNDVVGVSFHASVKRRDHTRGLYTNEQYR